MSMNIENMVEILTEESAEKELKIIELEKQLKIMKDKYETEKLDIVMNKYPFFECDDCDKKFCYDDVKITLEGLAYLDIICKECDEKMWNCLYCGKRGDPYRLGWVSERCRKEGETENMKDHPDCEYKGVICSSCEYHGEMMCIKCQQFNKFYQGDNDSDDDF